MSEIEALLARVPEGYTPGPWGVARRRNGTRSVLSTTAGETVCEVDPWSEDVDEADAALIALAPELAAALRAQAATIADLTRERDAAREALQAARTECCACLIGDSHVTTVIKVIDAALTATPPATPGGQHDD